MGLPGSHSKEKVSCSPSCSVLWHVHKGGLRAELYSRALACDGAACILSQVNEWEVLLNGAHLVVPA